MALLKLCVETGEDGNSHNCHVFLSLPRDLEEGVQKFLFLVHDACAKTSKVAWLDKTSDLHLRVPVSSQHASGSVSSLQLLGYGLKADLPLQRYLVVCSGKVQLSASDTVRMLTLSKHAEESPSLLEWETEVFPAHLDSAQTEMWGLPSPPHRDGALCLQLCRHSQPAFQEALTFRTATQGHVYNLHASLPSRRKVKVKVVALTKEGATYRVLSSSAAIALTTYLSKRDLETLRQMALRHRQSLGVTKQIPLTYFFRNRWTQYFLDILSKHAGVMAPYRKDHNGDPHSAINGNVDGLFFSASPDFDTCRPPRESLFGEWRLHVPVEAMFHEATNLYFADFWCHVSAHYVTLVLTNAGSQADQFCERRLLKLDPFHNDFLFKVASSVPGGQPEVHTRVTRGFHVELLYTESINIAALMASHGRDKVFFRPCELLGRGRSQPSGIEKKTCSICNLQD